VKLVSVLCGLLAVVLLASKANAQSSTLSEKAPDAARITATADQSGYARIIVEFAGPVTVSQMRPNPAFLAPIRAQIASIQDAIIATHFGSATNPTQGQGFPRAVQRIDILPMFAVNVTRTELEALAADPRVLKIYYSGIRYPSLLQTPGIVGMTNPNGPYAVGADGHGQAVAIIDTGVQSNHQFLSGKVQLEACFSNGGGSGQSLCPNGQISQIGTGAASSVTPICISNGPNVCQHGTHVAGIAAGNDITNQNTGLPTNGIAKQANIVAVQAATLTQTGLGFFDSDLMSALTWTYQSVPLLTRFGVQLAAVNMSLDSGPSETYPGNCDTKYGAFKAVIDMLRNINVVTTISAGNSSLTGAIEFPACISSAIGVASTDKQDIISSFTDMSAQVALMAPGGFGGGACAPGTKNPDIYSSVATSSGVTGGYACLFGTSQAAPHAAGAFAAIRSALPYATVDQILNAPQNTGKPIPDTRNAGTQTKPRIQVDLALQELEQLIVEFPTPTANSSPWGITAGPDGALWFTELAAGQIGRITTAGTINEFQTMSGHPAGITTGPDGALWFADSGNNKIGTSTIHGGLINEFPIPTANSLPSTITAGADGALWFIESGSQAGSQDDVFKIGRITTGGLITEYTIPTVASYPEGITAGPDGALWFTELGDSLVLPPVPGKIGRITTAGVITEYPISTSNSGPFAITTGPDGALWFTESGGNKIGRITTAGVITDEFPIPTANSDPRGITVGADGALWFTEGEASQIGRITTAGAIIEFPTPTTGSFPLLIAAGPDGAIWFTEECASNIGRLALFTLALQISPSTGIVASGFEGEAFNPVSFQYQLAAQTGSVQFSISGVPSWLTPSHSSGTATTTPQPVTFSVNAAAKNLAPGTYGPTPVTFTNSLNSAVQTISASLVVLPRTDAHDFNSDGYSDIAWRDSSGDLAFWLMNGASVLSAGVVSGVPGTWSIVGQRDFNGDGNADLLWLDNSGDIAMWFMNGTAIGSTAVVGTIPTNWSVAGVADFNGDGLGDILWRDTTGDYAMWLMNGATVASAAWLGNVSGWSAVGTGDFNGDSKADILWSDTSGDYSIWFMNGTSVASTALVGTVANWTVVGTGDFNGDGKSDIVWRDTAGDVAIWLMNGAAVSSAVGIGTVPTTWSIALVGDYDADGKSDLLWRDTSGNTAIWFMNGTSVASTAFIGTIPTNWTVQSVNAE
jgi:virginiamycin B lyase